MKEIRKMIHSDLLQSLIDLPEDMRNKKLELIITDRSSEKRNGHQLNKLIGKLTSLPKDPLIYQKEMRSEW